MSLPGCQLVTQAEMRELLWKAKHKKKGLAVRSFCLSKHHHPSISEAQYCNWLLARKRSGEIKDYHCQANVDLHIGNKVWRSWAIDFKVLETNGTISYHESKGWCRSDDRFRMKLGAFRAEYPEIPLYVNKVRITSGGWRRENYKTYTRPKSYREQQRLSKVRTSKL